MREKTLFKNQVKTRKTIHVEEQTKKDRRGKKEKNLFFWITLLTTISYANSLYGVLCKP
jgi:hypothetical protein